MITREHVRHQHIDRAIRFRKRSNRCLICHTEAGPGMTCGHVTCVRTWLQGRFPKLEIIVNSIEVLNESTHG